MAKQVVILPGILGSQLSVSLGFFGMRPIWVDPVALLLVGPQQLQLAPNGTDPAPGVGLLLSADGIAPVGVYEPLLNRLSADGWTQLVIGYDWRKSIFGLAQGVANAISAAFPTGEIVVVAHSMGGLVARAAYPHFVASGGGTRWTRTVYLGTPHGGSHSAAQQLAGWYLPYGQVSSFLEYWNLLRGLAGGSIFPSPTVQAQVKQTIASWPGLYALLPARTGPWQGADPNADALFNAANYATANPAVTQAHLDMAAIQIADMTALLNGSRPEEVCMIATNTKTPALVLDSHDLGGTNGFADSLAGDGSVLKSRGTLPGTKTVEVIAEHTTYSTQGQVISEVLEQLVAPYSPDPITIVGPSDPVAPQEPINIQPARPLPPWPAMQRKWDP